MPRRDRNQQRPQLALRRPPAAAEPPVELLPDEPSATLVEQFVSGESHVCQPVMDRLARRLDRRRLDRRARRLQRERSEHSRVRAGCRWQRTPDPQQAPVNSQPLAIASPTDRPLSAYEW